MRSSAVILLVGALSGTCAFAQDMGAAERWKPVDQPQLTEAFDKAQPLKLENVCDGPDECYTDTGPFWWVPNPDGKSWDMVLFYSKNYMGPHTVTIFDFGTGKLKQQVIVEAGGQTHMFYLRGARLMDGKLIIQPTTYREPAFWEYDPAKDELSFLGNVTDGKFGSMSSWLAADDGTIYGVGQARGTGLIGCYRLDPKSWKSEVLVAGVGPPNKNLVGMYGTLAGEGDWVYAAYGNTPWRLYAFNIKERAGSVIAESEPIVGDYKTMRLYDAGFDAVKLTTDKGLVGVGGPGTYWLKDGKVLRGEGDAPPSSIHKRPAPAAPGQDMGYESHHPPPGVEVRRMPPDLNGRVRCWYRLKGQALAAAQAWADDRVKAGGWGKFEFDIKFYPYPVRRMLALPDGRILALTESYGRAILADPAQGAREVLGPTMDVHTLTCCDGKVYMCGYSSSQVWEYDPSKPWTVGRATEANSPPEEKKGEAFAYDVTAPGSNPHRVAMLHEFSHVHEPCAAAGPAADGRIYFAGYIERIGNGGGIGWWDPKEQKGGGFYEPFTAYPIYWMCMAGNGQYLVISTKPTRDDANTAYTPPRGKLFVYDVAQHRIVQAVDAPFWSAPGYVTEATPGLVMGYASVGDKAGDAAGGVLYGFDPATGKVLWTKPVPKRPTTARSAISRGAYFFAKGPDGFIWATMGGVLCRIRPDNAEVSVVGKLEDTQVCFSAGQVYVGGTDKVRRILDMKVEPSGK